MIEFLKYRYQLNKLLSERKKTKKQYDSAIEETSDKSRKRSELISEAMYFSDFIDFQIRELHTDYLQKVANKLIVTIPNYNEENIWEKPIGYRRPILTNKGIHELKRAIRMEKKERREVVFNWIMLLTGLIGTLIGLVSVLK
ncbi:MAG: hypothetical protein ACFFDN_25890 [Candidatus Hodarchaeota archaeon]